jgi:hypothetical protein
VQENPNGGEAPTIQLVYETVPGQKEFNFPNQLGGKYGDAVKDVGVEATHAFENGDIIVVFSDGISDNMSSKEFLPCIANYLNDDAVGNGGKTLGSDKIESVRKKRPSQRGEVTVIRSAPHDPSIPKSPRIPPSFDLS